MEFSNAIEQVRQALEKCGTEISTEQYDGIIVKILEASNTLDQSRGSTKQTHIAITGKQMDIFPYAKSDGYFDAPYEEEDSDLKKYFIAQIPVYLHETNIHYLDPDNSDFSESENPVYVSIVRSRRKDGNDQIQMSLINKDSESFIRFRKMIHAKDYLIVLKYKEQLLYDIYAVRSEDGDPFLKDLNGQFFKLATSTNMELDKLNPETKPDRTVNDFDLTLLPDSMDKNYARRFVTSLLAKPFVIMTGNSGTGKTRIAKQFAEYLQVSTDDKGDPNWILVPVGADWTDNTKILGFYNPLADEGRGQYVKTKILELIERANMPENSDKPFFIILDEMNLSHVERYFSDFLSHMETPDIDFNLDGPDNKTIKYPSNLFIVGTVNIDETTYMFSPKVLDRANVIEFKPARDSILDLFMNGSSSAKLKPADNGTAESFYELSNRIQNDLSEVDADDSEQLKKDFEEVYDKTSEHGFEFGYRTVKEIRHYISAAYALKDESWSSRFVEAEDEQMAQKILPKIHGNKKEIGGLLNDLETICSSKKWTISEKKIQEMIKRLNQVQYASFI